MTTPIDIILRFIKTGQGDDQAVKALKDIEHTSDRAARGINDVGKGANRSKTDLKSFTTGAAAAGVVLGTVAVAAKAAYSFIGEGAELEAARGRFENLTTTIGTTADALLMKMRAATNGMVSDADLIVGASDIISLGLAKTEADTVRLATAVSTLGLDMQQVILTFANNSIARLDSLGLSVEGVTQKAAELEAQGFKGDAFDEAVIQGLEAKMVLLGDASETTAGKMRILEADWKNLNDGWKQDTAAVAGPIISGLVDQGKAMRLLRTEYEEGRLSFFEWQAAMGQIRNVSTDNAEVLRDNGIAVDKYGNSLVNTGADVEKMVAQGEELRAQLVATEAAQADLALTTYAAGGAYNQAAGAASSYDKALLQNYTNIQAANNAEIRWQQAMERSAETADEVAAAHAAAAAERAKFAAAGGDLFTEFSDADGALKFFNESLDELGQQYVSVGGRTAEQSADLGRLQGAYDKAGQTIRDYELGIKGANLSDEARNDKIAEQQAIMAGLAANMQPLLGIQGELVSVNNALSINQDAVNSAMYAAADAANADAAQLAILKVATGQMSEAQAEAVIKSVALQQTLENLGTQYATGELTLQGYISAAQQAVQDINGMTVEFNEQTGAISTANAEAAALIGTLGLLPTEHNFVIKITTDGQLPVLPKGVNAIANATGGPITGGIPYTGPGADNVIIGAQTGEYMLKRSAVNKLGLNRLNYMNSTGRLPGFAEGGFVGNGSSAIAAAPQIILHAPISVSGVATHQQGFESGKRLLSGLEDAIGAAQGRGVRI